MKSCHSLLVREPARGGGGGEPHRMARPFTVEREAWAPVTDLYRTAVPVDPAQWICCAADPTGAARVGLRQKRILSEQMKQVRQKQLLVLLLVMASQQNQFLRRRRQIVERPRDGSIDM